MRPQKPNSPEKPPSEGSARDEEDHPFPTVYGKRSFHEAAYASKTTSHHPTDDEQAAFEAARPTKRIRPGSTHEGLNPEYLLIHQVYCELSTNHDDHAEVSNFLDTPRLFAGDNKASALRGKDTIMDIDDYLEDHEHISIVVYKRYNCEGYHERIESSFERLKFSDYAVRAVSAMRPYLFVLRRDTVPATSTSEEMTFLSDDLKQALRNLQALDSKINYASLARRNWNIESPYLQLYHFRDAIRQNVSCLSDFGEQQQVGVLLRYIYQELETEYGEADDLFARGLVSQKHHSKLFGPNEVIVTLDGDKPLAFMSLGLPDTGLSRSSLLCESWNFDGVFERKQSAVNIQWPHESREEMPIVDLEFFPLKYDHRKTEERLLTRGKLLWGCRKRRYMSYRGLGSIDDVQTVRTASIDARCMNELTH